MKDKFEVKGLVILELRRHGNISRAARKAGITRRTIQLWKEKDRDFAKYLKSALEEGRENED